MKVVLIIYVLSVLFGIAGITATKLRIKTYMEKNNILKTKNTPKSRQLLGSIKIFFICVLPIINIFYGFINIFCDKIGEESIKKVLQDTK